MYTLEMNLSVNENYEIDEQYKLVENKIID